MCNKAQLPIWLVQHKDNINKSIKRVLNLNKAKLPITLVQHKANIK